MTASDIQYLNTAGIQVISEKRDEMDYTINRVLRDDPGENESWQKVGE
jgi:hypothetical protein